MDTKEILKNRELCDIIVGGEVVETVPYLEVGDREYKRTGTFRCDGIGMVFSLDDAIVIYNGEVWSNKYAAIAYDNDIGYPKEDMTVCVHYDEYFSPEHEMHSFYGGGMISAMGLKDGDYYFCYHLEVYCDLHDVRYCDDLEDWVHEDYCHYNPRADEYVYYERNIEEDNIGVICRYHESPEAIDLNNCSSPYSIGFEIEKVHILGCEEEGDCIGEYELFKGFELDSSCGVEAITNILPLSSNRWCRDYVFSLIDAAEEVINEETDSGCGGHINVSVRGYKPLDVFDKIRTSMGLFYALYRYRLNNLFCSCNKELYNNRNTKYSPLFLKDSHVEIRLPGAVKNTKQLKLRYLLTAEIMEHCFETHDTFSKLLEKVNYILMDMYDEDEDKVKEIKILAKHFWRYLLVGKVSDKIKRFIN